MSADNHTGFGSGYAWPGYPSDSWVSVAKETTEFHGACGRWHR